MKEPETVWVGITGSWRYQMPEVEHDVRHEVRKVIAAGGGIVTGGALGVDFWATDEVLLGEGLLKVIIPTPLEVYAAHYRKRTGEGVITLCQAESLIAQLRRVQARGCLEEMHFDELNPGTYYARNTRVVEAATEMYGFQVNGSQGTQDTLDKAQKMGRDVKVWRYLATDAA